MRFYAIATKQDDKRSFDFTIAIEATHRHVAERMAHDEAKMVGATVKSVHVVGNDRTKGSRLYKPTWERDKDGRIIT